MLETTCKVERDTAWWLTTLSWCRECRKLFSVGDSFHAMGGDGWRLQAPEFPAVLEICPGRPLRDCTHRLRYHCMPVRNDPERPVTQKEEPR